MTTTKSTKETCGQSTNLEVVGKATFVLTMAWYSITNIKDHALENFSSQQIPLDMRTIGKTTANHKDAAVYKQRKDFRPLYRKIAQDQWFKEAYRGKSFGDITPVES